MSIHVHIDRLVVDAPLLDGSSPNKARLAIERALVEQLATPRAAWALSQVGHLDATPSHALPDGHAPLAMRVGIALSQVLGAGLPKGIGRG